MSNLVINLVYAARLRSASLKAVAVRLADSAHDDGSNAFPSVGTIAHDTELDERTARRLLRKLEALGVIIKERSGGKGPRSTTCYRFNLSRLQQLSGAADMGGVMPPLKGGRVPPLTTGRGAMSAGKGGAVSTLGGHTAPRTLSEPSLEPPQRAGARGGGSEIDLKGEAGAPPLEPYRTAAISAETKAKARLLAPGWDIEQLVAEWRCWRPDEPVQDAERAFLGFCSRRGPHRSTKARRRAVASPSASVATDAITPRDGEVTITRLGSVSWDAWQEHALRVDRDVGRAMGGAFVAFVSREWPRSDDPAPRLPPHPKAACAFEQGAAEHGR